MDSFGEVIKEVRKKRKLTQKMLSENICSQSVQSRIENNEELPNVVVMQQICKRLGVTMDQIMQSQSEEVQLISEIFSKITYYFQHKEFKLLQRYLQESKIEERIYLDSDWQRYYYYLGNCEFFLNGNYEKAVLDFKKGLSYTFQMNKINISDIEIQLMSCLGNTYSELLKNQEAEKFLKLSIYYFHQLPYERANTELTKIFYNYAHFLFVQNRIEEAACYIGQGIDWARKKNSYYYLSELFQLKSELLMLCKQEKEAKEFHELSCQMQRIENISV